MSKNYDFDEDFMDVPVNEGRNGETSERIRKADKKKKKGKGGAAVLLIILVILVLGGVVGAKYYMSNGGTIPYLSAILNKIETPAPEETEPETMAPAETVLSKDSVPEVLDLAKQYYAARLTADADTLATLLGEGSTVNTDELASEKEFIEDYSDIATYIAPGMKEGEYAVYVSYDMKFKDIQTPAPGLEPVYAKPDADGNLKLLFYNDFDNDTKTFMNDLSAAPAVVELSTKVRESFQLAQDTDEKLKSFLAVLSGEAVPEETTAAETSAAETSAAETSAAETTAGETTTAAAETTAAQDGEIKFTETDDIQYTTTQVRLRKEPTLEENDDFRLLEGGVWVHVVATSEKWSKVGTQDGYVGYIYNDYLTPDKPETAH